MRENLTPDMPLAMLRASVEKARKELIAGGYVLEEASQKLISKLIADYTKMPVKPAAKSP